MAPSKFKQSSKRPGSQPKYWNVIDCDARAQPEKTSFAIPTALKYVSLNEMCRSDMDEHVLAGKESSYLLVSASGAITHFHQDHSGTSVLYFLMKGCKTFHIIIPTVNNVALFRAYLDQPRRDVFFGTHPDLDGGGCQKVVLTERMALCMPANMIHFVETTGISVAHVFRDQTLGRFCPLFFQTLGRFCTFFFQTAK